MNKKIVLIIDPESQRAEKLVFILRLGGYESRVFSGEAAACNWGKYGCSEGDVLCILCNHPEKFTRVEEIAAHWAASGFLLPVVLLQRGQGNWNQHFTFSGKEHFFVCEPESVLQTLEILTEIAGHQPFAGAGSACGEEVAQ